MGGSRRQKHPTTSPSLSSAEMIQCRLGSWPKASLQSIASSLDRRQSGARLAIMEMRRGDRLGVDEIELGRLDECLDRRKRPVSSS